MKNYLVSLSFISLFFIIFSTNVNAFQYFNYNPDFTTDINSYTVYEYASNISGTCALCIPILDICYGCSNTTQYKSCLDARYNSTNVSMILETNVNCFSDTLYSQFVSVKPLSFDNPFFESSNIIDMQNEGYWWDYTGSTDYTSDIMILPSNTEGIVIVNYRLNDTTDINYGFSDIKIYSNGNLISTTTLNPSNNAWDNNTIYIPSNSEERNITVFFNIYFGSTPVYFPLTNNGKHIEIGRFGIYTLDQSFSYPNRLTTAKVKELCNTTQEPYITLLSSTSSVPLDAYALNSSVDNLNCSIYQKNTSVIVRRLVNGTDYGATGSFIHSRDIGYYEEAPPDYADFIFNIIASNLIKFSCGGKPPINVDNSLEFYDTGSVNLTALWFLCNATTGIDYNYNGHSGSVSGNQFRYFLSQGNHYSPYFNTFLTRCPYSQICSANIIYIQNTLCDLTPVGDCGSFGCLNTTHCDICRNPITNEPYESYGSYCIDDYAYIIVNVSGCFYDSCEYPDKCFQSTITNIICGTEADLREINLTTTTNIMFNPSNAVASLFGNLFGIDATTDEGLASSKVIASIILSIICSALISLGLARFSKGKISGSNITMTYGISFVFLLTLFTVLGWFYWWLYLILALIGGLVWAKTSGLFGG